MASLKSQATIEMLSLVVLSAAVLAVVSVVAYSYTQQLNSQKTLFGGRELCTFLAREANTAASFGEGFQRSFDLPSASAQFSYTVQFVNSERRVWVNWSGGSCSNPLLANVTGALHSGHNSLKFQDGQVVLN